MIPKPMTNTKLAFMAIPAIAAIMIVGAFAPASAGELGNVDIDIKPGSFPNSINPSSNGVIPVAILGSDTFDVADVDPSSLVFTAALDDTTFSNVIGFGFEDVNDDGLTDLIAHFPTQTTWIMCNTTLGQLYGHTFDGLTILGFDSINPVGKDCRNNTG